MMPRISIFFLLMLGLLPLVSNGQKVVDRLVKDYQPNSYWLTLRYDHYLKSGSFLFVENNNRFNHDFPIGKSFPFNSIYRTYIMAGYEHKAHEKWYLGLSGKYVVVSGSKNFYTRGNISHRGDFLKMKFVKELALEHINDLTKTDNPNIVIQNTGRLSFSPSLVKKIKVAQRPMFFILNYRAYMLFDFVNDGSSNYDTRYIDHTRLRFEIDYQIAKSLVLSLFAIRDTQYSYRVNLGDEARVNRITPTFGLGINFIMNSPEDYIPGFPIK